MTNNGKDESKLSTQLEMRQITPSQWHTLAKSLYPGAQQESVLMVVDYCRSRGLDPLKKPCHIVPMKINDEWRDVVLPGIYELRTTAARTGEYLGHSTPEYGPDIDYQGVLAPEWCAFTVYRWNPKAQMRGEYPVTVYFSESCATKWDRDKGEHVLNARWSRAPRQMLTKVAEAAALRQAFPDELGGEMTVEEMEGQPPIEGEAVETKKVGPVKLRKVVEQLRAACDADDHGAYLEIRGEWDDEHWLYIWGTLQSWERRRIKELAAQAHDDAETAAAEADMREMDQEAMAGVE